VPKLIICFPNTDLTPSQEAVLSRLLTDTERREEREPMKASANPVEEGGE
jgi:hypothetical protein